MVANNKKKKKPPYAGVLVSQMLAAREAEKHRRISETKLAENRINETRINEVTDFCLTADNW